MSRDDPADRPRTSRISLFAQTRESCSHGRGLGFVCVLALANPENRVSRMFGVWARCSVLVGGGRPPQSVCDVVVGVIIERISVFGGGATHDYHLLHERQANAARCALPHVSQGSAGAIHLESCGRCRGTLCIYTFIWRARLERPIPRPATVGGHYKRPLCFLSCRNRAQSFK